MRPAIGKIAVWDAITKFGVWVVQHSPRTVIILFGSCAFLIFGSHKLLGQMRLASFSTDHPYIPGLAFVIFSLFTISYLFTWICHQARLVILFFRSRRYLNQLTLSEKKVLQAFFVRKTKSQRLDAASGVVNGLEHQGIIFRSSNLGNMRRLTSPVFAYNLSNWVWKRINRNPELISTPDGWVDPDRPDWMLQRFHLNKRNLMTLPAPCLT